MSNGSISNAQSVNSGLSGHIVQPVEIQQANQPGISIEKTDESTVIRQTTEQTTSKESQRMTYEGAEPNQKPVDTALQNGGISAANLFMLAFALSATIGALFWGMNIVLNGINTILKTAINHNAK